MNQTEYAARGADDTAPALEIDDLPLPYIEIDSRGVITRANRATLALHHPGQGELIGRTIWEMMASDEKDGSRSDLCALMQSGGCPPVITRNIFDRSGSFRTYQFHRSIIRDAHQNPAGIRMIAVDVTETTQALEAARSTLKWLESAMIAIRDPVFLVDPLGLIRSANPAAEAVSGFSANELIGKPVEDASPLIAYQPLDGVFFSHLTAIERPCRGIATLRNRKGEQTSFEMSTSPILEQTSGSVMGVVVMLRHLDSVR